MRVLIVSAVSHGAIKMHSDASSFLIKMVNKPSLYTNLQHFAPNMPKSRTDGLQDQIISLISSKLWVAKMWSSV